MGRVNLLIWFGALSTLCACNLCACNLARNLLAELNEEQGEEPQLGGEGTEPGAEAADTDPGAREPTPLPAAETAKAGTPDAEERDTPSARAVNEAFVKRFDDEVTLDTVVEDERKAEVLADETPLMLEPPQGKVAATLPTKTAVEKVATHTEYTLVRAANPDNPTELLMGWLPSAALEPSIPTAAPRAPSQPGASNPAPPKTIPPKTTPPKTTPPKSGAPKPPPAAEPPKAGAPVEPKPMKRKKKLKSGEKLD
jgi:hypothetical protein